METREKETQRNSFNDHDEEAAIRQPFIEGHEKSLDREQNGVLHREQTEGEQTTYGSKTAMALALYFLMNLGLTFYNKAVLGSFAFPWILTAVHTGCSAFGSLILLKMGYFKLTRLSSHEHLVLLSFSLLFTLNIAISNVSLEMVSVPFHQVMRATCPMMVIMINTIFLSSRYSTAIYLSIIPTIAGVGLATFGDYYFTTAGFTLTLLGVILAAIKTVVTNRLLTGRLRLPVFEVLLRMGPLAAVQSLVYSVIIGEFSDFLTYASAGHLNPRQIAAVGCNGLLAFALNVVSFQTNKLAGALSMTICANLKQCLTIVLGAVLWNVEISLINGAGILLALAGAGWYSSIELRNKRRSG